MTHPSGLTRKNRKASTKVKVRTYCQNHTKGAARKVRKQMHYN